LKLSAKRILPALLAACVLAPTLAAGISPWDLFATADQPSDEPHGLRSASETDKYRESLPGETSFTNAVSWAPRYFNVTRTEGFDDSLSKRWLTNLHLVGVRYEGILAHRLDHDRSIIFRPTAALTYNYSWISSDEMFRLRTVQREVAVSSSFQTNQLFADFGASLGYSGRVWEGFLDWRSMLAFRFQRLTTNERSVVDPLGGLIDNVESPVRNETTRAFMHSFGIGAALHFGHEEANYRLALTYRPFTLMDYDHRNGTLQHGIGLELKHDGLRLSDDSALNLAFRFDFWLPSQEFNDVFWFEINLGVRFS
jgi:hypothetical protein